MDSRGPTHTGTLGFVRFPFTISLVTLGLKEKGSSRFAAVSYV